MTSNMKKGKISESVLKRSVLNQLKMKREEVLSGAGIGQDCAIFALSENVFLASCIQEAAVAVEADMETVICKCVNNLAACGAEPIAALISLLLPITAEESDIKTFMAAAEKTCSTLKIQIAGGHTAVSDVISQTIVTITGYGKIASAYTKQEKTAKPGQDIVISKWIGLEGTALLAQTYMEGLLNKYPAYFIKEAVNFKRYLSVFPEAKIAAASGVCIMHDASEGGIFAALWEVAEQSKVGLTVDLKKIPIRQETIEICEYCNKNPYELLSGGSLIMVTSDGQALVQTLKEAQIPAAIVGKITNNKDRIIKNEEETRFLERPKTDEIYKIPFMEH